VFNFSKVIFLKKFYLLKFIFENKKCLFSDNISDLSINFFYLA
jgi:hypothetical protein